MNYAIILIAGKQGSGKSSLSEALDNHLVTKDFVTFRMKFADPLYKMHDAVRTILRSYNIDQLPGIDGPLLQLLGTEWGRKTRGEDIWVKAAKAKVLDWSAKVNITGKKSVFIFDDCRFPNELFAWEDSFKIRLSAPEEVRRERAEKWRENTKHPSEIALDQVPAPAFNLSINTGMSIKSLTHTTASAAVEMYLREHFGL